MMYFVSPKLRSPPLCFFYMHKHLIHLPPLVGWCVLISDFHSVSAVSLECYRAFVEQNRSRSSDREGRIKKTSYVNFVSSVVERFFLPLTTQCNSSWKTNVCTLKFLSVPMIKGDLNFSWILLTRKVTSQIFEMDAVQCSSWSIQLQLHDIVWTGIHSQAKMSFKNL